MKVNISNHIFYNKMIFFSLKGLIAFILLFVNKYIYEFMINQGTILKIFIIIILTLYIIQFFKKIIWYKNPSYNYNNYFNGINGKCNYY